MSSEKALALVLRVVDFSETSVVVTLFTREFGKIRALAKGARRPKSPFESALDLLSTCRIVFLRKSSEALDLLTEAKLLRRFRGQGRNLAAYYAGYYVAELMGALTDDADPLPELFDLASETLAALSTSGQVTSCVFRFELHALRLVGHLPTLDRCAECGQTLPHTTRIPFSYLAGGLLCTTCRPGKTQVVSVSATALETLVRLARCDAPLEPRVLLDRALAGEVRGILNHCINHLLGRPPRLQNYLNLAS